MSFGSQVSNSIGSVVGQGFQQAAAPLVQSALAPSLAPSLGTVGDAKASAERAVDRKQMVVAFGFAAGVATALFVWGRSPR